MMQKPEMNTTDFEMSHGRQPRGFGSWAFFFTRHAPVEEAFWVNQSSYSNARKLAQAEGQRRGVDTVYVGS